MDLKRHANDTTVKVPGQYASWPVIGPAAATPYRAFRLLITGPNASPNPASRHNFCLSNVEFYGFMYKGSGAGGWTASAAAAATVAAAVGQPAAASGGAARAPVAAAAASQSVAAPSANGSAASCSTGTESSGGGGGGSGSSSNSTPVGSAANSVCTGVALSSELHDGAADEHTK